ncbi:MAG: hypothetical protein PUA61_08275 [Succinatimonas hippei]|nr:hypothetical protein [Succinatimonas hippei]
MNSDSKTSITTKAADSYLLKDQFTKLIADIKQAAQEMRERANEH